MIADIILKVAAMEQEDHNYYPRPSIAGPERCIRQMVYWALGVERQPLPGRAVMIFNDSSFHEDLTGDWIRKSAYRLHSEQMKIDIGERYGIHLEGSIDGIITDMADVDFHLEHKAINHFSFQKYWGGEIPLDYINQTCIYNSGLQEINPDIDTSILLIKNKNTSQYLEFLILYDKETDTPTVLERTNSQGETIDMQLVLPELVDRAFKKFSLVKEYADKKTIPKRQYDWDEWQCDYCGWNQVCWKDYEKEFSELATDTMLSNEVADMVRYSKELAGHRLDMEKEEKELKKKIKDTMLEQGVQKGRAGEYLCQIQLRQRESLDKSLIPQDIREKAIKISRYDQLNIRKMEDKDATV